MKVLLLCLYAIFITIAVLYAAIEGKFLAGIFYLLYANVFLTLHKALK